MPKEKMKIKLLKSILCLTLAFLFVLSAASGAFPTDSVAKAANVYCNVKFSKPAICCDAGDTIDLSKCGVQFSAWSGMVTSGITWTHNGSSVSKFTPSAAGTYVLVAKSGSESKEIYVVAKNASDSEYVLYFNDFYNTDGFRTVEKTSGAFWGISGGVCYIDASASADTYVRILLPQFLDNFGDVKISSRVRLTSVNNGDDKWGSIMYRVQNNDYPFMQTCMRANIGGTSGLEIAERTPDNQWHVPVRGSVSNVNTYYYYDVSVDVKGTKSVVAINGTDIISHNMTPYTTGGIGFGVRGLRYTLDYVKITLDGNDETTISGRSSYTKPALRADIGDVIDLKSCDVQFSADALYTKGNEITWKQNGRVITTFAPTSHGVTTLTATANGVTKNVYVVVRTPGSGEYVLYYNDFSTAPNDFRIVEKSGTTNIYHNAAEGTYVIDASGSDANYGRVLLPSFLDDFGDMHLEARIKDTNPAYDRTWSSIMFRIQNGDYPYMQMCTRYNTAMADGVEIAKRNESNWWDVYSKAQWDYKNTGDYNILKVAAQGNMTRAYINGPEITSLKQTSYSVGAMGFQARGLKSTIDYVKITLGDTSAEEDTNVVCGVAASMPAIGCNAGQKILLNELDVQMVYGAPTVKGSEITWTYNGKVITEFEAPLGISVLKASRNGREMEIWVIGKRTYEHEFVLYYNDFNHPSYADEIRIIEESNGGKAYWEDGKYVLNGSASADSYVRILLPARLAIFGDAEYLSVVKLTNPVDETKWASMMYRVQNGNAPYDQGCLRYNASLSNGVEIAQKTPSGAWNVTQYGSFGGLLKDDYNWWLVNPSAKYTGYAINGQQLLNEYSTPYSNGDWGFQSRGLTLTIDAVKLSFAYNHTKATIYTLPGNYADVRDPETGILLAPSIVTEVKTLKDFNNLTKDSPAVAIVTYKIENGVGKVAFSDGSVTLEQAADLMSGTIIPAFRVNDNASVDSLVAFLKDRDLRDVYVVSDQPAFVKRACDAWYHIRGVQDYTGVSLVATTEDLRTEAVANGSRVMMLTNEYCTKERVTYIQDMFSCVWIVAGEGKTASVEAINKGPYGIVTPDRDVTEACYRDFYATNTIVRRPNVIGHRGVPTMANENSIAGLKTALANGATTVENDIYIATDGVLVVMHDSTIDRTTNGSGYVYDYSSTQLKNYVINQYSQYPTEPIPTLEDFFAYCKGDKTRRLVVEVKTGNSAYAAALKALIDKYQLREQVVVISFGSSQLFDIRALMPGIPVSNLTSAVPLDENDPIVTASNLISRAQEFDSVLSVGYSGLGYNVIRECAYRGLTLYPWTVDSRSVFDNLWISGAGGITTNYCHWASNYIADLRVNENGRVIATNYKYAETDVTNSVEMVVVEDTLGISFSNGVVNVPQKKSGGKASYFFRYKSKTGSGHEYYTVTEIQTVEVEGDGSEVFELVAGSSLELKNGILSNLNPSLNAAQVKEQFVSKVAIIDADGNAIADNDVVPTGATVYLVSDSSKSAVTVLKGDVNGDGVLDSTDYLKIKSYFLGNIALEGVYYSAADCDCDGSVASTDYMQLKSHFLQIYNLFE